MIIICFNGIDGSGKSSQAVRLVTGLRELGYPAVYVWGGGRTWLTEPVVKLGKCLLRAPRKVPQTFSESVQVTQQYSSYLKSTSGMFKYPGVWRLWLHLTLMEHVIKLHGLLRPYQHPRQVVVCDRYIYDSVVKTAFVAGLEAEIMPSLLRWHWLSYVPRPAKSFFLDIAPEIALERKDDIVTIQDIERRVPLYREVARTLKMEIIDGTLPPEQIARVIWQQVLPCLPQLGERSLPTGSVKSQKRFVVDA